MNPLKYISLTACAALTLASCSDDDYNPGSPVDAGCIGVYVSDDNDDEFVLDDEGDTSIDIKVKRMLTDNAVSVPVTVITEYEGYVAPATVDFAAGESEAIYTIDFPGISKGVSFEVSLRFPDSYVDPYTMVDGYPGYTCNVGVYPISIAEGITYSFDEGSDLTEFTTGELIQIGSRSYTITDFLGSGLDVSFSLGRYSQGYDWGYGYGIVPIGDNTLYYDNYGEGYWMLCDEASGGIHTWTMPAGQTVNEIYIYDYSEYYALNYSYMNISGGRGLLTADVTTGSVANVWTYIYISW